MFGGNDQPPPPPPAPLQKVESSAGQPVNSVNAMQQTAAKAEGAGALPSTTPQGQLATDTTTTKKKDAGSLLGES